MPLALALLLAEGDAPSGMNSVWLAVFGLVAFALGYRFYSRLIAERVFGLDDSRQTPAHTKADGVDYVPSNKHVLFGHHFTSVAGAAPILGPAMAVIWGWLPALLWIVFGTIFIGAVHDFGCLFVSTRNGGTTIADLTGKIVGPRARVLFLLVVFFLSWIVIAVFAVVIGSLFTQHPMTVLPVNFEIVVALVIGYLIYKLKARLLVPSLVALVLLYALVWVGASYTRDFAMPTMFKEHGRLTSASDAATRLPAGARLAISLHGQAPRELTLPAAEGGEQVATALQAAVRGLEGEAAQGFEVRFLPKTSQYAMKSGAAGDDSAIAFQPAPGAAPAQDAAASLGLVRASAVPGVIPARTETWVVLLLVYSFIASVLPVWLLLQPRDYINSHQLFLGLGAMYLGLLIAHPPVVAPALRLSQAEVGGQPWFPFLFVTIACGAISGFHGLVASGTTSKQVDKESDTRPIGYGSMLGEGALALMAVIACTAGLTRGQWHDHYGSFAAAGGMNAQLGAFVTGGASFLVHGLGLEENFAKAVIVVIVISFAATTLDTATRIQRFIFEEIASTYDFLKPLGNRYFASAVAAFLPLILVFGGGENAYWKALWPIFGASNQMLGCLCLLVLTFYLLRRGKSFWWTGLPCALLAFMTSIAMVMNLLEYYRQQAWLLTGLSVLLLALSLWILLEGVVTLRRLRAEGGEPPASEGASVIGAELA
ncbi:MAG: carbon starvation protein A [Planctomycetota bacterium]